MEENVGGNTGITYFHCFHINRKREKTNKNKHKQNAYPKQVLCGWKEKYRVPKFRRHCCLLLALFKPRNSVNISYVSFLGPDSVYLGNRIKRILHTISIHVL